jgi:hypothetical protein
MKKLLFVLGVLLLVGNIEADSDYYPLAVGNRWNYGDRVEEIVGTEVIDGKTYFLRRISGFRLPGEPEIQRERVVGSNVYYWFPSSGEERVLKLNASEGEEWTFEGGRAFCLGFMDVETPSGNYQNCLEIEVSFLEDDGTISYRRKLVLAQNVGIVVDWEMELWLREFTSPSQAGENEKSWGKIKTLFK